MTAATSMDSVVLVTPCIDNTQIPYIAYYLIAMFLIPSCIYALYFLAEMTACFPMLSSIRLELATFTRHEQ